MVMTELVHVTWNERLYLRKQSYIIKLKSLCTTGGVNDDFMSGQECTKPATSGNPLWIIRVYEYWGLEVTPCRFLDVY